MIPPFCLNPARPILSTCRTKFKPIPRFARKDRCLHRPLPFVPLHASKGSGKSIGNDLAWWAREEKAMRVSANEQGD